MVTKERKTAGQKKPRSGQSAGNGQQQAVKQLKIHESLADVPFDSGTQVPSTDDETLYRQWLSDQYIGLLKTYLKNPKLKESQLFFDLVSDYAELSFSAKEILDLHTEAIDLLTHSMRPANAEELVHQSRYLLLGVMIHLM